MRQPVRRGPRPPVLTAEAHTFGVGPWVRGNRGRGTLTLGDAALVFEPAEGGKRLEIALNEISEIGVTVRPPQSRVLVVTYRKNLVLGLTLEDPETWANAIQVLTGIKCQSPAAGAAQLTRFEVRRFRLAVALILLVVVVLSTAVPVFFTWMHDRVSPSEDPPRLNDAYGY